MLTAEHAERVFRKIPGQTFGVWCESARDIPKKMPQRPDAILFRKDRVRGRLASLVLFSVGMYPNGVPTDFFMVLSEAGAGTYSHTYNLAPGERYWFVVGNPGGHPTQVYRATGLGPQLSQKGVLRHYGPRAAEASRDDRSSIQVLFDPRKRSIRDVKNL